MDRFLLRQVGQAAFVGFAVVDHGIAARKLRTEQDHLPAEVEPDHEQGDESQGAVHGVQAGDHDLRPHVEVLDADESHAYDQRGLQRGTIAYLGVGDESVHHRKGQDDDAVESDPEEVGRNEIEMPEPSRQQSDEPCIVDPSGEEEQDDERRDEHDDDIEQGAFPGFAGGGDLPDAVEGDLDVDHQPDDGPDEAQEGDPAESPVLRGLDDVHRVVHHDLDHLCAVGERFKQVFRQDPVEAESVRDEQDDGDHRDEGQRGETAQGDEPFLIMVCS